jgi:hypothetical protein
MLPDPEMSPREHSSTAQSSAVSDLVPSERVPSERVPSDVVAALALPVNRRATMHHRAGATRLLAAKLLAAKLCRRSVASQLCNLIAIVQGGDGSRSPRCSSRASSTHGAIRYIAG